MSAVLALAAAQVALGGFDNVYHHELRERLPWTTTAHTEQGIHCIRGGLCVPRPVHALRDLRRCRWRR